MTLLPYIFARLRYDARSSAVLMLGVIVGSAVLTGALIVGDSMRGSLRDQALSRLGRVDYALTSQRFFSPAMGEAFHGEDSYNNDSLRAVQPAILLSGAVSHAQTRARVNRVQVFGVRDGFWSFDEPDDEDDESTGNHPRTSRSAPTDFRFAEEDSCFISSALANDIDAKVGDELLLSFGKPSDAPLESLLGRRDDMLATLRVKVAGILPDEGLGGLSLRPTRVSPRNVFVPLARLQRALHQDGRLNLMLIGDKRSDWMTVPPPDLTDLNDKAKPAELGLSLRVDNEHGCVVIESDRLLLDPAAEALVMTEAGKIVCPTLGVLAYLANEISGSSGASVPYSIVAGLEEDLTWWSKVRDVQGTSVSIPLDDEILLNEWTAKRLGANVGDEVTLRFFVSRGVGRLEEAEARFRLSAILPMNGPTQDPGLTPVYHGITDAERLNDWDPPFPFDAKKIQPDDEAYWNQYRAAPKAFISLKRAQKLWADASPSQGRLTSIRIHPSGGESLEALRDKFAASLTTNADLAAFGYAVEPVRDQAVAASRGTTDFSGLFLGFSSFLIVSACVLVSLLFRLGIERRAREIGLLHAMGVPPARLNLLLLGEGLIIACLGAAASAPVAVGYAWIMIDGLRTRWSAATQAPFLTLHVGVLSLVIGTVASVFVATLSMAWTLRGLGGLSAWRLIGGATNVELPVDAAKRSGLWIKVAAVGLVLVGLALSLLNRGAEQAAMWYFGGGAAVLAGGLCAAFAWLKAPSRRTIVRHGRMAMVRLGVGGARRHRGRSLLTAMLMALAMFLIASLTVFHLDPASDLRRDGGTGGFAIMAESSLPLPFDLSSVQGQTSLGLSDAARDRLRDVSILPYRLRPGDSTSCLGLYAPSRPRILGATPQAVARGGFSFAAVGEDSPEARANPWTLLARKFDDGAIPAIGDEAAVRWQLHSGLNRDLVIEDEAGKPVTLRFVALLRRSVLQDELIVSEAAFRRMFPSQAGHTFFLVESPQAKQAEVAADLERELAPFGMDATPTRERLAEYFAVQNTYLATFQSLGGLGLMLGAAGLAVVMLRNVVERRSELGLMQALGFSARALLGYMLSEGAAVAAGGLLIGLAGAATAVGPFVAAEPQHAPWLLVGASVAGTLTVGIVACWAALAATLRGSLIGAIRRE